MTYFLITGKRNGDQAFKNPCTSVHGFDLPSKPLSVDVTSSVSTGR